MRLLWTGILAALIPRLAGAAASSPPGLCESAVRQAADAERVPDGLLPALAIVESGRRDAAGGVRPWPWTINVGGEGRFFSTKDQAIAAARELIASGVRSIDIGCMQVNLMHHPTAFANLEAAFDPRMNARYGARFLISLYERDHDWSHAIAAYHSETPEIGAAYGQRVIAVWKSDPIGAATAFGAFVGSRRAAYSDFLPQKNRYAAFGGCRCTGAPGVRQVCRCD